MINQIITQYLTSNKRLVIPEFGAFIRKDTGDTVFVEFLKKDDHVFTGLITDAYSVDETEARLITEQFVEEVKKSVARTGMYIIGNLGILRRDANGIYELNYDPSIEHTSKYSPEPETAQASSEQHSNSASVTAEAPVNTHQAATAAPDTKETTKPKNTPATDSTISVQPQTADSKPGDGKQTVVEYKAKQTPRQQEQERTASRDYSRIYNDAPARQDTRVSPFDKPIIETPAPTKPVHKHKQPPRTAAKKKKTDLIMIIAVIAALIAIASMVFGIIVENDPLTSIKPTASPMEQVESPSTNDNLDADAAVPE